MICDVWLLLCNALLRVRCSLFAAGCIFLLLNVVCCCWLFVVGLLWLVVCGSLCVVCCLWFVDCCVLFVVC